MLDNTVKVGPEWYVYLSKTGKVYVDDVTRDAAESAVLADPSSAPTAVAAAGTSGIPAGDYSVKYTWVDAAGETLPSEAAAVAGVTLGQNITVTLPAFPAGAVKANIYIGTTDNETLQGSTKTPTYVQNSPLVAGATPPTANTTGPAPDWKLVGYCRYPVRWNEPQVITDVYKGFNIDHTKRGKQQRKTLSIKQAYTNMNESFRNYLNDEFLVKVECHPNDGEPNEAIYFTSVRILTPTWEIPDEEASETLECIFAKTGSRDLSA